MTGLKRGKPRELHPFKDPAQDTVVEIGLSLPERDFPDVIEHCDMAYVIVGVTPVLVKVSRVARECPVTLRRINWIAGIIEAVGPCVSPLKLEAMIEAMRKLDLQRVVAGISNRALVSRLDQGIVRDGIERKDPKIGAVIQIDSADVVSCTFEGIEGIAAKIHQFRNQRWIWRVAVH